MRREKHIYVLLIIVLALSGFAECNRSGDYSTDDGTDSGVIEFDSSNAIGVGWIPYEKPYIGTTTATINLRAAPTVEGEIVTTVEEGTELKLTGISAAGSIVMDREEWIRTLPAEILPSDDTPFIFREAMPTRWFRVEYEGEAAWAHSAFVGTNDYIFNGPPYYNDDYPGATTYFVELYDVLTFNGDGALRCIEVLGYDYHRLDSATPFNLEDRATPYYGETPGEPVYDLRRCTPQVYELYTKKERGAPVPDWYKNLPSTMMVCDYVVSDSGVWISDIAGGRVAFVDTGGEVKTDFVGLTLPVHLCSDGAGGVWVADPYAKLTVRLNEKGEPLSKIEGFKTLGLFYDIATGLIWVHGFYKGDTQLWLVDKKGVVKSKFDHYFSVSVKESGNVEVRDFRLHYGNGLRRAVFERAADGSIMLYRSSLDSGT